MPPNVIILPKEAAKEAARVAAAQARAPNGALELHLFCDASYKDGSPFRKTNPQSAIAVVVNIWPPKATTNQRTSKACFIPSNDPEDNNLIAEAFALAEGVYVALDQIARMEAGSNIGPTDRIQIVFWSDCQYVLKELRYGVRTPRHPKRYRHIIDIIELKTRELECSRKNVSVQFLWCPEECVEPHKTADELSKRVRISGSSGAQSKALHLFRSLPHSAIQSALSQSYEDKSPSEAAQGDPIQSEPVQSEAAQSEAAQIEAVQSTDTSIPPNTDGYDMIRVAVHQLPPAYMEMMLVAIKLQEMVNTLATDDQTRNQVQDSEDDQEYEVSGQEYEHVSSSGKYEGQGHEHDDFSDEDEDEFHDAREPGDREDGDHMDGELAIAGGGEARPNRMRAVWNWVRGRPRL